MNIGDTGFLGRQMINLQFVEDFLAFQAEETVDAIEHSLPLAYPQLKHKPKIRRINAQQVLRKTSPV